MRGAPRVAQVDRALRAVPGVTVLSDRLGQIEVARDRAALEDDLSAALAAVGHPTRAA